MNVGHKIAAQLDGQKYPWRESQLKSVFDAAKDAGLVIVFGASDDLIEFRGLIFDEGSAYEGGSFYFDAEGILPVNEDGSLQEDGPTTVEQCRAIVSRFDRAFAIKAKWGQGNVDWSYELDPRINDVATFDVVEGENIYCRGVVFRYPYSEALP